jgi:hypothetical protein
MPAIEYFLLAQSVSTDQDTNLVSVFHIMEEFPTKLPGVIPKLVAVSSWNMADDDRGHDFQVTLRVPQPSVKDAAPYRDFPINFTTDRMRHRVFHHVKDVPVNQFGDLVFEILLNGEPIATHRLTVKEA